jgi:hypothetical protein
MARTCRLPKDLRNTVINANIGDTSDTLHIQVPSHHMQQKRLLELKGLYWKEWAFINGSCITNKTNWISVYWSWSVLPSNKITTANPGASTIPYI